MMTENEWCRIFGKTLLDLLKERGYTQQEFAEEAGLSSSSVSAYVHGHKTPGVRALVNIAYTLDISFDELMDFGDKFY